MSNKSTRLRLFMKNIQPFKRAIQSRTYLQPHASTNHLALQLNSIVCSTYILHGTERIKCKGSEINLVTNSVSTFLSPFFSSHDQVQIEFDAVSWVFKQGGSIDEERLRPDILIHAFRHGRLVEVTCGEVEPANTSQQRLNEDKMRVLEIMKRQLHVRLRYGKSPKEAITSGIFIQGNL